MNKVFVIIPVHSTLDTVPVLLYPVLHVHWTALVVGSCEHTASLWHPPLLTWHASVWREICISHWVRMIYSKDPVFLKFTCTDRIGSRTTEDVTNFACTFNCISDRFMWTICIGVASTVIHLTCIYRREKHDDKNPWECQQRIWIVILPVQVTTGAVPVLV